MNSYDNLYINGAWVPPAADKGYAEVIDSSTEEVMAKVVQGGREDVDRAVAAARDAFTTWSTTPVDVRAKYLRDIGAGLTARFTEIAETISGEVGSPRPSPRWSRPACRSATGRPTPASPRSSTGRPRSATAWWCVSPSAWSAR